MVIELSKYMLIRSNIAELVTYVYGYLGFKQIQPLLKVPLLMVPLIIEIKINVDIHIVKSRQKIEESVDNPGTLDFLPQPELTVVCVFRTFNLSCFRLKFPPVCLGSK